MGRHVYTSGMSAVDKAARAPAKSARAVDPVKAALDDSRPHLVPLGLTAEDRAAALAYMEEHAPDLVEVLGLVDASPRVAGESQLSVPCPTCHAAAEQHCRAVSTGNVFPSKRHSARVRAVEEALAERYHADIFIEKVIADA